MEIESTNQLCLKKKKNPTQDPASSSFVSLLPVQLQQTRLRILMTFKEYIFTINSFNVVESVN